MATSCPVGTEMVVNFLRSTRSTLVVTPSPRVSLLGEWPGACMFLNGHRECDAEGQLTFRFTYNEFACDTTKLDVAECPFPMVGRMHGICAAAEPCGALN